MSGQAGMTGDELAIWEAMRGVYAGFLAGDPGRADSHLHPGVTIWDSAEAPLVVGLAALHELRGRRASGALDRGAPMPAVTGIDATHPVVSVWGDTALLRHLLRVRFSGDTADQLVRNTSVWRRTGGRWLCVHNHEDVLAAASGHEDVLAAASGHEDVLAAASGHEDVLAAG